MSRIAWDEVGEKTYHVGVDRGVLYPNSGDGVPWNGLVGVSEKSSGGEATSYYFDGRKYLDQVASEDFEATIEAFTYPDEFSACDGTAEIAPGLSATRQIREPFGFCYRTLIGSDISPDHGYKIHIVWNATALPSTKDNKTIAKAVDPNNFQWTVRARPPKAEGNYKATAHFTINSTRIDPELLEQVENILYGTDGVAPSLPTQFELVKLLEPSTEVVLDGGTAASAGAGLIDGGTADSAVTTPPSEIDGGVPTP